MADKTLITGASSGIGREFALLMAEKGHDLVLVSRTLADLKKVKKQISSKFAVSVSLYISDLSEAGSAEKLYEKAKKEKVGILINNAGVGYKGDFFGDDLNRHQKLIQLNITSLMDMTYYFGNDMIKTGSGKILNLASIAAFIPGSNQPSYYASKAFVRSYSRALAHSLRKSGVSVTLLHPGVTKTKFFEVADAPKQNSGAEPRDVALTGYNAMMAGKVETTHGLFNKLITNAAVRILPYRVQAGLVSRSGDI
jgi:short-subunit dehydrogenase